MAAERKEFKLSGEEILRALFCDASDTEDTLELDGEDIGFLEIDVDELEAKSASEDIDMIIDPARDSTMPNDDSSQPTNSSVAAPVPSKVSTLKWKKVTTEKETEEILTLSDS